MQGFWSIKRIKNRDKILKKRRFNKNKHLGAVLAPIHKLKLQDSQNLFKLKMKKNLLRSLKMHLLCLLIKTLEKKDGPIQLLQQFQKACKSYKSRLYLQMALKQNLSLTITLGIRCEKPPKMLLTPKVLN